MITLGISYSQMHDSSACLVRDGEVLFAIAEERLSRVKHDGRFPVHAIRACLVHGGITADQLDEVCFGWPAAYATLRHDLKCYLQRRWPVSYRSVRNSVLYALSMWHQRCGGNRFTHHFGPTRARMRFVDHHLAHAISAYAFSGFSDAAVVVIDGRGAWESTSIWYGHDGRLDHVLTIPWPNSLGLFYAEFTGYLGFERYSDEWKLMGLAPYGEPGVDLEAFIIPDEHPYWVNARRLLAESSESGIEAVLGPRRLPESEIDARHKNIAFAVQDACERAILAVVRLAVEKTRSRKLCLAGGVALNTKANGRIIESGLVDSVFVQPAAGDDGAALGAALTPYMNGNGLLSQAPMRHVYLGPESTEGEIKRTLQSYKLRYSLLDDVARTAAELLANGKIIGWYQGRMEFGPRALGNRSILADPRDPEMHTRVNKAVKFREWWRPFAPSVLAEEADEYLESVRESPFMILTFSVKRDKRAVIPSVTHVDGSARPQTVEEKSNRLYWRLINEFRGRTGVPVVMNTSFNLRGEPIVASPTDAIRTFFSSGLDALVIDRFLVEK